MPTVNGYPRDKIFFSDRFAQKIQSFLDSGLSIAEIENKYKIDKWIIQEVSKNPYGNIIFNPLILKYSDCLYYDIGLLPDTFEEYHSNTINTSFLLTLPFHSISSSSSFSLEYLNADTINTALYEIIKYLLKYPTRLLKFEFIYQTVSQYYSSLPSANKSDIKRIIELLGYSEYNGIVLPTIISPLKEWRKNYCEKLLSSNYKNTMFLSQMKFHLQPPMMSSVGYPLEVRNNIIYLFAGISYKGFTSILINDEDSINDEEIYCDNVIKKMIQSIQALYPLESCRIVLDTDFIPYIEKLENKFICCVNDTVLQPVGGRDCNPMEYIWNLMNSKIIHTFNSSSSINSIIRTVRLIWAEIRSDTNLLSKCMRGCEANLNSIIRHKGSYSKIPFS